MEKLSSCTAEQAAAGTNAQKVEPVGFTISDSREIEPKETPLETSSSAIKNIQIMTKENAMKFAFGVGGVLALTVGTLFFVRAEPSVASQGQDPPTFELSAVRTDEVIKLRSWGGMAGRPERNIILYGDGRVVNSRGGSGESRLLAERYVEFDEVHDIVGKYVTSGAVNLTREKINEELSLRFARATDLSTVELTVNLDSLNGSPEQGVFQCTCLIGRWVDQFPDRKEPAAIRDLIRWMREKGAPQK